MNSLYFVRHGQAGTRDAYDMLSPLGRRQARLLGEYLVSQKIEFMAAYTGRMLRQRQTADEVRAAYIEAGAPFPEITVESGWSEFDLAHIYREIGPQLCEQDQAFRSQYEALREDVRASAGDPEAAVHRRWRPCDTQVVDAWISGKYRCSGESWEEFRARIMSCRVAGNGLSPDGNVALFTSATPTAIWAGMALDILDQRVRALAGVLHNASYTVLRQRAEQLQLFMFNAVPHLATPELRTHR